MKPVRALLLGTFTVGVLDIVDAFVFFGLRSGVPPVRILQSIAAGLLGRDAFRGGIPTALLGAVLHFFIAFCIVGTYLLASWQLPSLTRKPIVYGLLYGVAVYFVMNLVVVPLSAAGGGAIPPWPHVVNGLLIHALGVGLPSSLFATAGRNQ